GIFHVATAGSRIIFQAYPAGITEVTNIYGTDGTANGTQLVASLRDVIGVDVIPLNDRSIYYTITDTATNQYATIYSTDGTVNGTQVVLQLPAIPGQSVVPTFLVSDGGAALFQVATTTVSNNNISYDLKVYMTDGTPSGTKLEWDLGSAVRVTSLPTPLVS